MLTAELKQHYLDTTYIVYLDSQQFDIHVEHTIPDEIQQLFDTTQKTSASIVTAWNPRSQALSLLENKERNESLLEYLKEKNYSIYNALGQGKDTSWQAEESYFIVGVSKEEAELISIEYQQYAFVWIESCKSAQLVFTQLE